MTPRSPAHDSRPATTDRHAHTVFECSSCGERFVGISRCPDGNLFMHTLGIGRVYIHCDEPLLVDQLLDDQRATLLD
jgi:hypothetical protein